MQRATWAQRLPLVLNAQHATGELPEKMRPPWAETHEKQCFLDLSCQKLLFLLSVLTFRSRLLQKSVCSFSFFTFLTFLGPSRKLSRRPSWAWRQAGRGRSFLLGPRQVNKIRKLNENLVSGEVDSKIYNKIMKTQLSGMTHPQSIVFHRSRSKPCRWPGP